MKKNLKIGLLALISAFAVTSCSDEGTAEDVLTTDPDVTTDEVATIMLTEGGADDDVFYAEAEGEAGGTVEGRVIFTAVDGTQRRLYVTETLPGGSAEAFEIAELSNRGTKADGSIDLDGEQTDVLDFTFTLNVPDSVEDGTIVYNFWSTTGKGDFRDTTKRLLIGVGSIEVSVGTGENPDAPVRTFGDVTLQLDAPLQDGTSNTFMSVYNGEIYQLDQGEEFAAFWDFGYYWIESVGGPSLASTTNYFELFSVDGEFVGVSGFTGIEETELNNFYIAESTMDFDTVVLSSDLDVISTPMTQVVNGIEEGKVYEFEDQYGTKGLIRIVEINGTDGSDGYITFDIKVQAYSAIDTSDL